MLWQGLPAEGQAPVEVAAVVLLAVAHWFGELEGVEVDAGDVRAHHGRVILRDASQQGLQPAVETFAWEIQTPFTSHHSYIALLTAKRV